MTETKVISAKKVRRPFSSQWTEIVTNKGTFQVSKDYIRRGRKSHGGKVYVSAPKTYVLIEIVQVEPYEMLGSFKSNTDNSTGAIRRAIKVFKSLGINVTFNETLCEISTVNGVPITENEIRK